MFKYRAYSLEYVGEGKIKEDSAESVEENLKQNAEDAVSFMNHKHHLCVYTVKLANSREMNRKLVW